MSRREVQSANCPRKNPSLHRQRLQELTDLETADPHIVIHIVSEYHNCTRAVGNSKLRRFPGPFRCARPRRQHGTPGGAGRTPAADPAIDYVVRQDSATLIVGVLLCKSCSFGLDMEHSPSSSAGPDDERHSGASRLQALKRHLKCARGAISNRSSSTGTF